MSHLNVTQQPIMLPYTYRKKTVYEGNSLALSKSKLKKDSLIYCQEKRYSMNLELYNIGKPWYR